MVDNTDIPNLYENIKLNLQNETGVKASILISSNKTATKIQDSVIFSSDCLITNIHKSILASLFNFSDIILYRTTKIREINPALLKILKEECIRLKITLIEFDLYEPKIEKRINEMQQNSANMKQLIVSDEIIQSNILVEMLERKLKFQLVDRDLFNKHNIFKANPNEVDILLNEFTAIKIFFKKRDFEMKNQQLLDTFFKYLNVMKYKVKLIYIICLNYEESYLNPKNNSENFSRLSKFIAANNKFQKEFKIKIIYLDDIMLLDEIIENVYLSTYNFRKKHHLCYYNLKLVPTKEEIFLLSMGIFNSFSSQYLLRNHRLAELVAMNNEEFKKHFKLINPTVSELFYSILAYPVK